jgi:hypothetical protein
VVNPSRLFNEPAGRPYLVKQVRARRYRQPPSPAI